MFLNLSVNQAHFKSNKTFFLQKIRLKFFLRFQFLLFPVHSILSIKAKKSQKLTSEETKAKILWGIVVFSFKAQLCLKAVELHRAV